MKNKEHPYLIDCLDENLRLKCKPNAAKMRKQTTRRHFKNLTINAEIQKIKMCIKGHERVDEK